MIIKNAAEMSNVFKGWLATTEKYDLPTVKAIKNRDWDNAFWLPPYPSRRRRFSVRQTKKPS